MFLNNAIRIYLKYENGLKESLCLLYNAVKGKLNYGLSLTQLTLINRIYINISQFDKFLICSFNGWLLI